MKSLIATINKIRCLAATTTIPLRSLLIVNAMIVLGLALAILATTAYSDDPGWALYFDGNNDFVVLDETSQIMGAGWEDSKTISLWVKPTGTATCTFPNPNPTTCDAIFGDRARWWGISRGEFNGLDRIWIWNWSESTGLNTIPVEYTVDEWIHIALVHDQGMLRAYKFGLEVGSVASDTTRQPDTGAQPVLHFGGIMNNETRVWAFEGEIDEVRIWNYGRTGEELTADMLGSLTGNESGLMAYYKMSDGAGLTVTDDSGNGWDGALEDGAGIAPPDGHYPEWVDSGAFIDPPPPPTPTYTPTSAPSTSTPTPTSTSGSPTATATATQPTPGSTVTGTPPTPSPTATGTPPTLTPTATATTDIEDLHEQNYLPLFLAIEAGQ